MAYVLTGGQGGEEMLDAQLAQDQLDVGERSGTAHRHGHSFSVQRGQKVQHSRDGPHQVRHKLPVGGFFPVGQSVDFTLRDVLLHPHRDDLLVVHSEGEIEKLSGKRLAFSHAQAVPGLKVGLAGVDQHAVHIKDRAPVTH
ncbi:hypothetical protein ABS71_18670 [bacterium SCN 62-11]|nr:MAG: hypothetical protein ABS71_18670 [bacterium SCN 62-11]